MISSRSIAIVSSLALGCSPIFARAQAPAAARADTTEIASSPARANFDTTGERELRAIIDELSAAVLRHDAAVVQRYYSPDYVMTFSSGRRGGFENSLHVLTDTTRNQWRLHDVSNERIIFYGTTAIATFTAHSRWTVLESHKDYDVREHVTQTWIRRDGRWTLVATHVTAIDPSQP